MTKTPQKNCEIYLNESLTPVRFLDSPNVKSPAQDANYAVCKSRMDVLVKQLIDNYAKWQLAHKRGLALCTSIEAIKTRCIDTASKESTESLTLYPNELKPYCDKLSIISSIFVDITNNTRDILRQLKALHKLPGSSNACFYRTWQLSQFVVFTRELLSCYELESEIKQSVMREIAHCMHRRDLITCTSVWEYPQHVDDHVAWQLRLLEQEIKIKSIIS